MTRTTTWRVECWRSAIPAAALLLAMSATALTFVGSGYAQEQGETSSPPADAASAPRDDDDASDPTSIFRGPLIREGSAITDSIATIHRDPQRGWWKLVIDTDRSSSESIVRQEFVLMPCTQLSQMQHIVNATPGSTVTFQVSGRVFVFRGRNYLLPTYAPVVVDPQRLRSTSSQVDGDATSQGGQTTEATSEDQSTQTPPSAETADQSSPPKQQRAADIMRDLEKAVGPLPRSSVAANGGREDAPPLPSQAGSDTAKNKVLPEEAQIVNRRGKITRDSGGGWLFVFDADANGLADPPMRLLPCLLLERIEDYARRSGNNSPALLSGAVYLYEGQNYLLPTVFRIPAERRNITP